MKRLFILGGLLLCLGISAPLAVAADSFDINRSLADNLAEWTDQSQSSYLKLLTFASNSQFDVLLAFADPDLMSGRPGGSLADHQGFKVLRDVSISNRDLVADFFPDLNAASAPDFFLFRGTESLAYEWDGKLINLVPGTVFMGFDLGGGNGADMVLLLTPAGTYNPVPLPAAVWLFGTGVAGLAVMRRKLF